MHWAFLILAFIAGFASCYALIYYLARLCIQIEEAIAKACSGYLY